MSTVVLSADATENLQVKTPSITHKATKNNAKKSLNKDLILTKSKKKKQKKYTKQAKNK